MISIKLGTVHEDSLCFNMAQKEIFYFFILTNLLIVSCLINDFHRSDGSDWDYKQFVIEVQLNLMDQSDLNYLLSQFPLPYFHATVHLLQVFIHFEVQLLSQT